MFRKRTESETPSPSPAPVERVTSVLGEGIVWKGNLSGTGGIRIEGAFDGDIVLRGLLVIGESGRVTGKQVHANVIIVAGAVQADITAEKVEIRSTGRVWGNVVTAAFATEEGAFLRGQIRMEDQVELASPALPPDSTAETAQAQPAAQKLTDQDTAAQNAAPGTGLSEASEKAQPAQN
jgi:cytoskeletal protein CcmA (bactofilin family)